MFTDKKEYTIKKIIALWTQYMALWNQFIKLDLMVMLLIISNIFSW